jgi:bacterial/archaeal transporter family-2 protein
MPNTILAILIGLLGGIAIGFQSPVVGLMSAKVGGTASSLIVHLSGALLSLLLLLLQGGDRLSQWRELPWLTFGAGAFGLTLFLTLSYVVLRLGATNALVMVIIGQLLVGLLVDHFGLFGLPVKNINLTSLLATALLIAGGILLVRR